MSAVQSIKNDNISKRISDILTDTILFSDASADVLDVFVNQAVFKRCKKGQVLFINEEPAEYFYIIASGWVKLFRESLDGNEAVVDVLNKGHMFGETSIFEQNIYAYGAEVVENAELLMLPLSILKQQIEASSVLSLRMLHAMSRFRKQQDFELEHRDLQNASQRIGCFLLRLCKPNAEGSIVLQLPYDKTLIASRLGMKPETFSRALAKLRNETGILLDGSTIRINTIKQLSDYSCSACSSLYPCQDLH